MIIGESSLYELSADERVFFSALVDGEDGWDTETGKPGVMLFANAVQVWALHQPRSVSVADAATVFNVSPVMVAAAVKVHPWMYLNGPPDDFTRQTIEHEGE